MPDWKRVLDRAKAGRLTQAEAQSVVAALSSDTGAVESYTLLQLLGLSGRTDQRDLVYRYLRNGFDPDVSAMALKVLFSYWGAATGRDVAELKEFLAGVSWDPDGDARMSAASLAGEYLRSTRDHELLTALWVIWLDPEEDAFLRQAAYAACARAIGVEWSDVPAASRSMDILLDAREDILARVLARLREEA